MRCKYPDKPCKDSYWSHAVNKEGRYCRLKEWKQKRQVCPYDHRIFSTEMKIRRALVKEQTKLVGEK
jgi:hypothetical protein